MGSNGKRVFLIVSLDDAACAAAAVSSQQTRSFKWPEQSPAAGNIGGPAQLFISIEHMSNKCM